MGEIMRCVNIPDWKDKVNSNPTVYESGIKNDKKVHWISSRYNIVHKSKFIKPLDFWLTTLYVKFYKAIKGASKI